MNEYQRKWLLYLQEKGVRIDLINLDGTVVERNIDPYSGRKTNLTFAASAKNYRLPAQSVPSISDWREVCWGMQDKGVKFKMLWGSMWNEGIYDFEKERDRYQLIEQPIPEWKEEMTKETKLDPREEIPHRELQIQWHEDMLHHLRTGEPMREYEFRSVNEDGDAASEWKLLSNRHPSWAKTHEYRRKPKTVTYWHCFVDYTDKIGINGILTSAIDDNDLLATIRSHILHYPNAKYGPITETTVEMEE